MSSTAHLPNIEWGTLRTQTELEGWVFSDTNALYGRFRRSSVGLIGVSLRSGNVVRIVQTGRVVQNDQYRCRIEFAMDHGGDELVFERKHSIGGLMSDKLVG